MTEIKFTEKFICFIDILGFKELVKKAENGSGMSLEELLNLAKKLGQPSDQEKIAQYGPLKCPDSKYNNHNLDFKLTQITDCAVVSCEISPAGVINLINHCWSAVIKLMMKGIMCRGYITKGSIYHSDEQVIGSGYEDAYQNEPNVSAFKKEADERGTPFVEVDPVVCDYIQNQTDSCVVKMFKRFVEVDSNVTALFPFKMLQHEFIIGDVPEHKFDPEKERESNTNTRLMLEKMKNKIVEFVANAHPDAKRKADYYIKALNTQIENCLDTDGFIDELSMSFSNK